MKLLPQTTLLLGLSRIPWVMLLLLLVLYGRTFENVVGAEAALLGPQSVHLAVSQHDEMVPIAPAFREAVTAVKASGTTVIVVPPSSRGLCAVVHDPAGLLTQDPARGLPFTRENYLSDERAISLRAGTLLASLAPTAVANVVGSGSIERSFEAGGTGIRTDFVATLTPDTDLTGDWYLADDHVAADVDALLRHAGYSTQLIPRPDTITSMVASPLGALILVCVTAAAISIASFWWSHIAGLGKRLVVHTLVGATPGITARGHMVNAAAATLLGWGVGWLLTQWVAGRVALPGQSLGLGLPELGLVLADLALSLLVFFAGASRSARITR